MADTVPYSVPRSRLHGFLAKRVKFLLVAMPAACAVLLLPLEGWLLELLRHFRLWCAGLAVILLGLTLLLRLWRWAPVAVLAAVWQGWPWWFYADLSPAPAPAAEKSLTVLTANLLYEAREPERMVAVLREADADVIVFQEFTAAWQTHFQATLWKDYPYRVEEPEEDASGICLASRLPLVQGDVVHDPNGLPCVTGVVRVGGTMVSILGVHPMPPMRPEMYASWRAALESYPAMLEKLPGPHRVLTGDLNATPFCRVFTRMAEAGKLTDSARVTGIVSTWYLRSVLLPVTMPAGLPLDHVLVTPELGVVSRSVGPAAGSDHRFVRVQLAVP
jgi:endonuclease/exonuclease/phosphatase (EEP) superfamily protein YafD